MRRIAGIIVNMVPYHHARWEAFAAASGHETHLIELTGHDEFKVLEFFADSRYRRHTLFSSPSASGAEIRKAVGERLDALRPDVVCVSGWGLAVSLAALEWASRKGIPSVMLSESNEFDEPRALPKEFIKRRLVGLCSAGLAGGTPQADYLVKLGLPEERVFTGYDVIDNDYFARESAKTAGAPRNSLGLPEPYFFACARFGKKKNIPGLIRAFARYLGEEKRKKLKVEGGSGASECSKLSTLDVAGPAVASQPLRRRSTSGFADDSAFSLQSSVFDLVIAGEGEERSLIEKTIRDCGVADHVHLVGPKGYGELPFYYANAAAFIHASTTEQWGLVVNEAMASGLPVLVSNRCGCAADLVQEGVNGWTFDPANEEQIALLMQRISADGQMRQEMGRKSREIISKWGPERFASGLSSAIEAALSAPKKRIALIDRLILRAITRR